MLWKIKQLLLRGHYSFTDKAHSEIALSGITKMDVLEAITSSRKIDKVMKTTSYGRTHKGEMVYVIRGFTHDNIFIYTKGTIKMAEGKAVTYRLISAKKEGMF